MVPEFPPYDEEAWDRPCLGCERPIDYDKDAAVIEKGQHRPIHIKCLRRPLSQDERAVFDALGVGDDPSTS